jgi:hypothetical protein
VRSPTHSQVLAGGCGASLEALSKRWHTGMPGSHPVWLLTLLIMLWVALIQPGRCTRIEPPSVYWTAEGNRIHDVIVCSARLVVDIKNRADRLQITSGYVEVNRAWM